MMNISFPKIEQRILKFWQKNKIFKKTLKKTKRGQPFIFFEGPPTANAKPGVHHVLSRVFKDIISRYKTMQGYYVTRKAGWDTHGLPVELEIEKRFNLRSKKEVEKIGLAQFNQACKKSVWQCKKDWENFSERIAFWLDYQNPYITYDRDYIESVWFILKKIWQKGLLFQDDKVVPHCPRCETTLSSHEVALGYKNIEDTSLYLKFPLVNKIKTFFLVWTTTPWTLPGNVALAIQPNATYLKVKIDDEYLILAEPRISLLKNFTLVKKYQGKNLIGRKYEPLYNLAPKNSRAYEIIAADFVSVTDGTGIVHLAPAFGEEDMNLIKTKNEELKSRNQSTFPILVPVKLDGTMDQGIIGEGKFVKEADKDILNDLENRRLLWQVEKIFHDYPFCWRCNSPLLYYVKKSWFIKMSESKIKEALLKNNEKINWIPAPIKEGRFGEWLKEVKDWNISRERFWGTPLPIWRCQSCNYTKVIGSIKELNELSGKKIKDLHRPLIDEIKFKCEKCNNEMKRVLEVIDCWFDSGAMPFAQDHWPFEQNKKISKNLGEKPPENFPADFIAEGIDQTRGWFYTLLAISTLLGFGPAYKNVICLGLVLDEKGEKMSKSRGNVVEPEKVISQYGADVLRFYFYTVNQPGETKYFSVKQIEEVLKNVFLTLFNILSFIEIYAEKKNKPTDLSKNILDQWVLAKLNFLIKETTCHLDNYEITEAGRKIAEFINELSTWYLRRRRECFKDSKTKKNACSTLTYVLLTLSKILAPFTPFLAEEIYQRLGYQKNQSVHLENWPKIKKVNQKLIEEMREVKKICESGHALRKKNNLKVRQPLAELKIKGYKLKNELADLIRDELNVKKVIFDAEIKEALELNTVITPELREEGILRELVRQINELRKKMKLTVKDKIEVYYQTESEELLKVLQKNIKILKKQTLAKSFINKEKLRQKQSQKQIREIEVNGEKIILSIMI